MTEAAGLRRWPRGSPSTPSTPLDPDRWLDPALRFPVLDRSDAEGLGRDDPGAVLPERIAARRDVGDGAEVMLVGHRSTAWYSGAPTSPRRPRARPAPRPRGAVGRGAGRRARRPGARRRRDRHPVRGPRAARSAAVAEVADELRRQAVGDAVTWVRNRNINYTNVCTFKCRFCGFSKGPLSLNLRGTPYLLDARRHRRAGRSRPASAGATEVMPAGRHPPRASTATTTSTSPGP